MAGARAPVVLPDLRTLLHHMHHDKAGGMKLWAHRRRIIMPVRNFRGSMEPRCRAPALLNGLHPLGRSSVDRLERPCHLAANRAALTCSKRVGRNGGPLSNTPRVFYEMAPFFSEAFCLITKRTPQSTSFVGGARVLRSTQSLRAQCRIAKVRFKASPLVRKRKRNLAASKHTWTFQGCPGVGASSQVTPT